MSKDEHEKKSPGKSIYLPDMSHIFNITIPTRKKSWTFSTLLTYFRGISEGKSQNIGGNFQNFPHPGEGGLAAQISGAQNVQCGGMLCT